MWSVRPHVPIALTLVPQRCSTSLFVSLEVMCSFLTQPEWVLWGGVSGLFEVPDPGAAVCFWLGAVPEQQGSTYLTDRETEAWSSSITGLWAAEQGWRPFSQSLRRDQA